MPDPSRVVHAPETVSQAELDQMRQAIEQIEQSEGSDVTAGTRFLVIEIPPAATLEQAEELLERVADTVYGYEVESQNWDPFVYGWTFPEGQAVERPKRTK